MTCDELKAAIHAGIAKNARLAAIRKRIDAGKADFLDSELYTAITAEITAEQMRDNVLALADREPAFVDIVHERYTDTFAVFSAVQRILDAAAGIRIRTAEPGFQTDRAHKIGHSLNDLTVPDSVIERRAYSATENYVRSQHDRCTKANALFRSRAGLDCRIIRTGGGKCCEWCAGVSGSFTAGDAPKGIWGRHDNCKCSIIYETRRGGFQQLSGTGKGWDTVEELPENPVHTVSAEKYAQLTQRTGVHFLSGDQIGAGDPVVLTAEQAERIENAHALKGKKAKGFIPSVRMDAAYGEAPIAEQFQRELSDEYDKFESIFGKISTVRSVMALPYKNNGVWGMYNDNSGELILFGAGGAYGKETTARAAKVMRKEGKWSTASVYHSFRHELGHALQASMKKNDPDYSQKLEKIETIRKALLDSLTNLDESAKIELMKKRLSVYGLADETDEFISECIAEFCNGNPRETAKTVVDILLSRKV